MTFIMTDFPIGLGYLKGSEQIAFQFAVFLILRCGPVVLSGNTGNCAY